MQTVNAEIKKLVAQGVALPLMEEFYTIQGEGYHKGTAAYFVRLAGCRVGCHWCDVKESWNPKKHPVVAVESMAEKALLHSDTVVITGGEPLTYNLDILTKTLRAKGAKTHIETCGAYPLSGYWDWICLSPKERKLPLKTIYPLVDELKMVIHDKHDLEFAEEQSSLVSKDCLLYLQPEWGTRKTMIPQIVDYVMQNPKWKVSLQTHKYLNIP
ncbi:MAG: 7-carboxy-7-deazaguanine synthase QueE [Bacteroidota bacterium]